MTHTRNGDNMANIVANLAEKINPQNGQYGAPPPYSGSGAASDYSAVSYAIIASVKRPVCEVHFLRVVVAVVVRSVLCTLQPYTY